MAATTVTDSGGVRIITEVIPATDPRAAQLTSGSSAPAPARTSFQTQGFRRAHPKVLGTIHIFSGIIHICFGIILTVSEHGNPSLPVASGIFFWLGILLLVSGSLLMESERRDNPMLVRSGMGGTTCPPIPYIPSSGCRHPSTAWIHPTGSTGQSLHREVPGSPTWSTRWGLGPPADPWDHCGMRGTQGPGHPQGLWNHCGIRGTRDFQGLLESLWDEGDTRSRTPSGLLESLWNKGDEKSRRPSGPLESLWNKGDKRSRRPLGPLESLWHEWDKTRWLLQEIFDPRRIGHVGSSSSLAPCHRVLPIGQDLLRGQRGSCPGHAGGHRDPRHGHHPAPARLRETKPLPDPPGMVPRRGQQDPEQRAGFHLRAPEPPGILRGRGGSGVWIRGRPATQIHPAGAVANGQAPHVVPHPGGVPGTGAPRDALSVFGSQ